MRRVYLGAEYRGPHAEALTPLTLREFAVGATLAVAAVVFGVFPQTVFHYMAPSVNRTVDEMAQWMKAASVNVVESATEETPEKVRHESTVVLDNLSSEVVEVGSQR